MGRHTSPDDIDGLNGASQRFFDGAAENFKLFVTRKDESRYDKHGEMMKGCSRGAE